MSNKIWIGNERYFQWAPCPLAGLTVNNVGFSSVFEKENGGRAVTRSARYSKEYNVSFSGLTSEVDGINAYNRIASGLYGTDPVVFNDPFAMGTNILPVAWSAPGLIELGWNNIGFEAPTSYADVVANNYNLPQRKASFFLTMAANATPLTNANIPYLIVPLPPGYDMYVSINAAVTASTANITMEFWNNGGATPASTTTFSSNTGTMGTGATGGFQDNDANAPYWGYKKAHSGTLAYAKIYMTRTSASAVYLTLTSMRIVLVKSGSPTPTISGWLIGEGHVGLKFADSAIVENYVHISPTRKGISTTLLEVT